MKSLIFISSVLFSLALADIKVGFIGYYYNNGAVNMALEKAAKDGFGVGENISYYYVRETCTSGAGSNVALDLINKNKVDVILGVDCTPTCVDVGQIAAYNNVPFLPTNCMDERADNKSRFSTTIRVAGSFPLYAEGYLQILQHYGWGNVVLFTHPSYDYCASLMGTVASRLRPVVKQLETIEMSDDPSDADLENYAARAKYRGKVLFLCHKTSAVLVKLMYKAQDLGMAEGDYVYLKVTQPYSRVDTYFDLVPVPDNDKVKRRQAFQAMKQLVYDEEMTPAGTLEIFQDEVTRRNQLDPWKSLINSTQPSNYFATYTYDAAYLWSMLVSEMKKAGLDYKNGPLMQQFSRDKTFTGISRTMSINDNSDARKPMLLYSYEPGHVEFRPFIKIDLSQPTNKLTVLRTDVVWGQKTVPPSDDMPQGPPVAYYNYYINQSEDKKALAALIISCITAGVGLIALFIGLVCCMRKQMLATDKLPLN